MKHRFPSMPIDATMRAQRNQRNDNNGRIRANADYILGMIFDQTRLSVMVRPESNIEVGLKLQNMTLNDHYSQDIISKSMITRSDLMDLKTKSNVDVSQMKPLMSMTFEMNPLDKIADTKVVLSTLPITADLHIPVFLRLGTFFAQESQADLHAFERAALLQLEAMKKLG